MSARLPVSTSLCDAEERFEGFEKLMPFKVHNILLVSSLYDSFILREDGRLNELLIDESLELNLRQIPANHARVELRRSAESGTFQSAFQL